MTRRGEGRGNDTRWQAHLRQKDKLAMTKRSQKQDIGCGDSCQMLSCQFGAPSGLPPPPGAPGVRPPPRRLLVPQVLEVADVVWQEEAECAANGRSYLYGWL